MKSKINTFLNITILTALALTSCTSNKTVIATAVAMTVQAQNTQSSAVTDTPLALATMPALTTPETSNTPVAVDTSSANTPDPSKPTVTLFPTPLAASTGATKFCTASATFVSETVPDGTIISPGATFTKSWTIQNSGTCPWDSTWKLVFVSGNVMGAAFVFNFPQTVPPGQNVTVPVVFTAPTDLGVYTGYWKIQSPWGMSFGDSGSGNPFWVTINVNSGTPSKGVASVYDVTAADYKVSQRGCCTCGANIFYTTTATISSNGPLTIYYYWAQSDGGRGTLQTLTFSEASSKTVSDEWAVRLGTEIGIRWEYIVVTSPVRHTFSNTTAQFDHECI